MGLVRLQAPAVYPVSLAEARTRLRIDDSVDDAGLQRLIAAATRVVEQRTQHALVTQQWEYSLWGFPNSWDGQLLMAQAYDRSVNPVPLSFLSALSRSGLRQRALRLLLPLPPLQSVEWIRYLDSGGDLCELDTADYVVDPSGLVGAVMPAYGKDWPNIPNQAQAVRIAFTAGTSVDDVEPDLILAILLLVAHFDQNREAVSDRQTFTLPLGVEDLLAYHSLPATP